MNCRWRSLCSSSVPAMRATTNCNRIIEVSVAPNARPMNAGNRPSRQAASHAAKKFQRWTEKYKPIMGKVRNPTMVRARVSQGPWG